MGRRMIRTVYHAVTITALMQCCLASCTPLLVFHIRPRSGTSDYKRVVKKLEKKDKIASYDSLSPRPNGTASGIFSTYAGYLGVSRFDGKTVFPLQHSKPFISLVVTNKIIPVLIAGNTIDHWEIPTGTEASFYTIERKHDAQTDQLFWQTQTMERPADNIIPREALIIIAKPHNIDVQTGISLTSEGPHFFLPDVHAKKGVELIKNSLYMLNLSHFFSPVKIHHQFSPTLHIQKVVN